MYVYVCNISLQVSIVSKEIESSTTRSLNNTLIKLFFLNTMNVRVFDVFHIVYSSSPYNSLISWFIQ